MIAELPLSAEGQSPLSDLMTMVAKKHLGEVAAIVISALISHGRLGAKDLSKKSGVPIKLVKTTLVSLIQLNCVLYWQERFRRQVSCKRSFYEGAKWQHVLRSLIFGSLRGT
jgi:DNA-directed RNA polymerase III subunit RPC3